MQRSRSVDAYIEGAEHWKTELKQLRKILCSTRLKEEVKWGLPCYSLNGKLVVGIAAFKSYVGLWFFQGALLSDPANVLINAQEGRTKAQRQWRFHSKQEIESQAIKFYVEEAIELWVKGFKIGPDLNKPLVVPPELKSALADSDLLGARFRQLTKGRQREYADYIAGAKREVTKARRMEKILPKIAQGKGLNDYHRGS